MKSRELLIIGLMILVVALISPVNILANQSGSLPTGGFWFNNCSIEQVKGDYSFQYVNQENNIGEDGRVYLHFFTIILNVNITSFNKMTISFNFSTPFESYQDRGNNFAVGEIEYIKSKSNSSEPSFFQLDFTPIQGNDSFYGDIFIQLTVATESEMSEIIGSEVFGIELTNGTRNSKTVTEFYIHMVQYSEMETPTRPLLIIHYYQVIIVLLVIRRVKIKSVSK